MCNTTELQNLTGRARWHFNSDDFLRRPLRGECFSTMRDVAICQQALAEIQQARKLQQGYSESSQTSIKSRLCNIAASIVRVSAMTAVMSAFVFSAQALILSAYGS